MDDNHAVAEMLHGAAVRLLRRLRRADDATGLSAPRLSALSVLVFRGEMALGELARAEQVKPPTMTRLVAELEAAGLVQRRADPLDARGVLLRATGKGRKLLQQGRESRLALLVAQIECWPAAKRRRLADGARLILELAAAVEGADAGMAAAGGPRHRAKRVE